jgi:acid phosphatase type 7
VYDNQLDATGAMHVTIGDGGNREGLYTNWKTPTPTWSFFHKSEYGSGLLRLINKTTAEWEWHENSSPEPYSRADSYVLNNIAV